LRSNLIELRTTIMNDWEKHLITKKDNLVRNKARC